MIINGQRGNFSSATNVPIGGIILWGQEAIPDGWAICDGTNGTIDLRGVFPIGAGGKYSLGDQGGEEEVTLTIQQMPNHSHDYNLSATVMGANRVSGSSNKVFLSPFNETPTNSAGQSQPHNNLPPYKALYYIQRVR